MTFFKSLLDAISMGDEAEVSHIIELGGLSVLSESDENGMNCLHWAALLTESERLVPCLTHYGAEVNIKNNVGETPLHICCAQGRLYAVICLLHRGADPNSHIDGSDSSTTPLAYAIQHQHSDIARLLIGFGAETTTLRAELKVILTDLFRQSEYK